MIIRHVGVDPANPVRPIDVALNVMDGIGE
jgi:hypothetical protein